MTNIDTLKNIAGANWTKRYIDRDLNVPERCAFGRMIQLIVKLSGCDFLRSSLNSLCSVDLVKTATKLTVLMQKTLAETDAASLDETHALLRRAADNFNKITTKTNGPVIDVEAIINNQVPADAVASASAPVSTLSSIPASTPSNTPSSSPASAPAAVSPDAVPEQPALNVEKDADPVADEQTAALNDAPSDAADSAAADQNPAAASHEGDDESRASAPLPARVSKLATTGHDSASESGTDSDAKPIRRKKRLGTSVRISSKPKNSEGHGSKSARINAKHK